MLGASIVDLPGPEVESRPIGQYAAAVAQANLWRMLAYLDPGSGSLLLQALVGGVASAAVFGRVYWRRAKRFLRIGRNTDES